MFNIDFDTILQREARDVSFTIQKSLTQKPSRAKKMYHRNDNPRNHTESKCARNDSEHRDECVETEYSAHAYSPVEDFFAGSIKG